ncbi:MAG: hypothetical protein OXN27_04350 [Candidatus Poribacteria bacterium]|nr:hypothetical protein [Candidatus Poribacteria bacterium]
MPNRDWEQTQFRGIHAQSAKTADGHLFAQDMENLRIDSEGWLQLRSDAIAIAPDGANITGVATTLRHVFTLRADGRLYVREGDTLASEIEITGVENLSGRISLVSFNTYVILTSEGADQGYIIDLREGENYQAYPLGFSEPGPSSYTVGLVNEIPSNLNSKFHNKPNRGSELSENTYYHYLYTIVSLPDDKESPWYGMESNPPQNELVDTLINGINNISEARGLVYSGVNAFNLFQFRENESFVKLTLNFVKPLPATHIRIYRSNPIENAIIDLSITEAERQRTIKQLFSNLDYRLVLEAEISQVSGTLDFYDGMSDADWAEGQRLETTNDRMPREVKQISEYNDLIFGAAGDRLIYSDLRQGVIVPWAFPKENDIRVQGSVNFCGEINEVLLFGSRDGIWRLAGNTEYNFAVGQISNAGPIDGYAWSKIMDALAFVGEGGLFMTDASQVIRASETVLDGFFQDKKVIRGAVAFFKDGDVLYSVTLEDSHGNTADVQFKREDGYWVRWNLPFMQSASIVEGSLTLVLVADGTGQLKRLDWNSTANQEENVAWSWTSQFLDEPGPGLANRRKRYSQFQFTGEAANTMLLQIWKDNEVDPAVEKTFESRANLIPVRVPINRIARRLRFKLSGTGRVKIQGIRVEIVI